MINVQLFDVKFVALRLRDSLTVLVQKESTLCNCPNVGSLGYCHH